MSQFDPSGDIATQLDLILNRGIVFEDNVLGGFVEFTSTGEVQEIEHNLGFTPNGFVIILKTANMDIWATTLSSWNSVTLFLNTNASSQTVRLFVL